MLMGSNSTLRRDLIRLVRLEYDALAACQSAKRRAHREADVNQIEELERTHQEHIRCLVPTIGFVGGRAPRAGDWRQIVTQGRVLTASVFGPNSLLLALKDNEIDIAHAYRRVLQRDELHEGIRVRLSAHAENASRHCGALREQVERETE